MNKLFNILVIDDDEDDQFLIQSAFLADRERYQFRFATNGSNVLENIDKSERLPDLIFLDLNMPIINGFEVLRNIKNSSLYRHIPVIILSTSDDEQDVNRCYELGANTFMVKPSSHQDLMELANLVRMYWFSLARIPTSRMND
ncbi:response regulator [Larkinella insperata]|uniref:Response regulator n=1 Tax=Larkinella insperata TaxID=332158 RepID=A0ABW3Q4N1_9BACT|nr:response regulator [Larkinella insperata]